jgi:hypothetical protein
MKELAKTISSISNSDLSQNNTDWKRNGGGFGGPSSGAGGFFGGGGAMF